MIRGLTTIQHVLKCIASQLLPWVSKGCSVHQRTSVSVPFAKNKNMSTRLLPINKSNNCFWQLSQSSDKTTPRPFRAKQNAAIWIRYKVDESKLWNQMIDSLDYARLQLPIALIHQILPCSTIKKKKKLLKNVAQLGTTRIWWYLSSRAKCLCSVSICVGEVDLALATIELRAQLPCARAPRFMCAQKRRVCNNKKKKIEDVLWHPNWHSL